MIIHPFWGDVDFDHAGPSSGRSFDIPYFDATETEMFLGPEFDDDGEEIDTLPSAAQLDEYEQTFTEFCQRVPTLIQDIQQQTFDYYRQTYAHYYEKPFATASFFEAAPGWPEGQEHPPLGLNTKEKHFAYLKGLTRIRIADGHTLRLELDYKLDGEHGLEILLVHNKIEALGGIADT